MAVYLLVSLWLVCCVLARGAGWEAWSAVLY